MTGSAAKMMDWKWERMRSWLKLYCYPNICKKRLRKHTKTSLKKAGLWAQNSQIRSMNAIKSTETSV